MYIRSLAGIANHRRRTKYGRSHSAVSGPRGGKYGGVKCYRGRLTKIANDRVQGLGLRRGASLVAVARLVLAEMASIGLNGDLFFFHSRAKGRVGSKSDRYSFVLKCSLVIITSQNSTNLTPWLIFTGSPAQLGRYCAPLAKLSFCT